MEGGHCARARSGGRSRCGAGTGPERACGAAARCCTSSPACGSAPGRCPAAAPRQGRGGRAPGRCRRAGRAPPWAGRSRRGARARTPCPLPARMSSTRWPAAATGAREEPPGYPPGRRCSRAGAPAARRRAGGCWPAGARGSAGRPPRPPGAPPGEGGCWRSPRLFASGAAPPRRPVAARWRSSARCSSRKARLKLRPAAARPWTVGPCTCCSCLTSSAEMFVGQRALPATPSRAPRGACAHQPGRAPDRCSAP
mmetsp:Transcript_131546/g.420831  ORF Transcript_131546/g.420831 Transcript_131546/m.420831 type:complete len:254 (+) Transcript_131546:326-1087(+)